MFRRYHVCWFFCGCPSCGCRWLCSGTRPIGADVDRDRPPCACGAGGPCGCCACGAGGYRLQSGGACRFRMPRPAPGLQLLKRSGLQWMTLLACSWNAGCSHDQQLGSFFPDGKAPAFVASRGSTGSKSYPHLFSATAARSADEFFLGCHGAGGSCSPREHALAFK
jgi:hypothetical protein